MERLVELREELEDYNAHRKVLQLKLDVVESKMLEIMEEIERVRSRES